MKKNRDLLRKFNLELAKAGDAICWSHLDESIMFVGRSTNNNIAIRREDGVIETPYSTSLRMKPLFWKDDQPVYRGDSLWHTIAKKWIVVTKLQGHPDSEEEGYFVDDHGLNAAATLCTFDAQPVPLFQLDGKDVFAGDKLWNTLYRDWMIVASLQEGASPLEGYFVATDGRHGCSKFCSWEESPQPLFTLDGQPVFKGTRLWHNRDNAWVTVVCMQRNKDFLDENGISRFSGYCTWDKPKSKTIVVRYANVYSALLSSSRYIGELFTTPDGASGASGSERSLGVARIEWEE